MSNKINEIESGESKDKIKKEKIVEKTDTYEHNENENDIGKLMKQFGKDNKIVILIKKKRNRIKEVTEENEENELEYQFNKQLNFSIQKKKEMKSKINSENKKSLFKLLNENLGPKKNDKFSVKLPNIKIFSKKNEEKIEELNQDELNSSNAFKTYYPVNLTQKFFTGEKERNINVKIQNKLFENSNLKRFKFNDRRGYHEKLDSKDLNFGILRKLYTDHYGEKDVKFIEYKDSMFMVSSENLMKRNYEKISEIIKNNNLSPLCQLYELDYKLNTAIPLEDQEYVDETQEKIEKNGEDYDSNDEDNSNNDYPDEEPSNDFDEFYNTHENHPR